MEDRGRALEWGRKSVHIIWWWLRKEVKRWVKILIMH
jgi:hypothetical protein